MGGDQEECLQFQTEYYVDCHTILWVCEKWQRHTFKLEDNSLAGHIYL